MFADICFAFNAFNPALVSTKKMAGTTAGVNRSGHIYMLTATLCSLRGTGPQRSPVPTAVTGTHRGKTIWLSKNFEAAEEH
eukprot:jgi/Botrbrau1/13500/Bobra.0082s0093.1